MEEIAEEEYRRICRHKPIDLRSVLCPSGGGGAFLVPNCLYNTYLCKYFSDDISIFSLSRLFFYICSGMEELGDQSKVVFASLLHQLHGK
jgi:hypothetical protein